MEVIIEGTKVKYATGNRAWCVAHRGKDRVRMKESHIRSVVLSVRTGTGKVYLSVFKLARYYFSIFTTFTIFRAPAGARI